MEIRPCRDLDELRRTLACVAHYFAFEPDEEQAERFAQNAEVERVHAAWDGEEIVGGAGAFSLSVTVPGGTDVRAAGVTIVGVLPTHRRRGILTGLIREQLDDVRRRGEPLALLWATEATIYGRFGYGVASLQGEIELALDRSQFTRTPPPASGRIVSLEEALDLVPPIYDRVRRSTPGMIARTPAWWEHRRLYDAPWQRRGAGPLQRVVLELDGEPQAYALYRIEASWEGGVAAHAVIVHEALGATPPATAAIWRFLLDVDWMTTLRASLLPVDHELFLLLAEPRRMGYQLGDALWCRLVDVEAALAARSYAAGGEVVLEVADAFCPWNEGHWLVGAHGAERTESPGELALDAADLGSVYLGGFTFVQLVAAGRAQELEPGASARADALFLAERAPWCPEIF